MLLDCNEHKENSGILRLAKAVVTQDIHIPRIRRWAHVNFHVLKFITVFKKIVKELGRVYQVGFRRASTLAEYSVPTHTSLRVFCFSVFHSGQSGSNWSNANKNAFKLYPSTSPTTGALRFVSVVLDQITDDHNQKVFDLQQCEPHVTLLTSCPNLISLLQLLDCCLQSLRYNSYRPSPPPKN